MQRLDIKIFNSPEEAPNYNENGEGFKPAVLTTALVVRNGTQDGNATIDLQFEDDAGNKYIAMVTAALLKTAVDVAIMPGPPNMNSRKKH